MMCDLMGGLVVDSLLRSVGAVPELCRALRQVTLLQSPYTVKNVNDFPVPSRDVTDQTLPGQE